MKNSIALHIRVCGNVRDWTVFRSTGRFDEDGLYFGSKVYEIEFSMQIITGHNFGVPPTGTTAAQIPRHLDTKQQPIRLQPTTSEPSLIPAPTKHTSKRTLSLISPTKSHRTNDGTVPSLRALLRSSRTLLSLYDDKPRSDNRVLHFLLFIQGCTSAIVFTCTSHGHSSRGESDHR